MIKGKSRTALWKVLALCVVSAAGNAACGALASGVLGLSLYLDTVFTVAVTFSFGLLPGLLTGVLLYPGYDILRNIILNTGAAPFWAANAFILCTVSEILLVWLFRSRIAPEGDTGGISGRPRQSFPAYLSILWTVLSPYSPVTVFLSCTANGHKGIPLRISLYFSHKVLRSEV
ncbi:MAG: hypothetical protein LBF78_12770 [Treponema sp.]|jgi:hypothetical protein|nr:hypothetical protein [Treponema sp.]